MAPPVGQATPLTPREQNVRSYRKNAISNRLPKVLRYLPAPAVTEHKCPVAACRFTILPVTPYQKCQIAYRNRLPLTDDTSPQRLLLRFGAFFPNRSPSCRLPLHWLAEGCRNNAYRRPADLFAARFHIVTGLPPYRKG